MSLKTQGVSLIANNGVGDVYPFSGPFEFKWKLVTGGAPHRAVFYVDSATDEKIRTTEYQKVRWALKFEFGASSQMFSNLFITKRGRIREGGFVGYTLVDQRYVLQNIRIDTEFNKLRTQNGFVRPSGFLTPSNIGVFQQVRMESFVEFTLKSATGNGFHSSFNGGSAEPVPWTAYEALLFLLSGRHFDVFVRKQTQIVSTAIPRNQIGASLYGIFAPDDRPYTFSPPDILPGVVDNGYVLKNWNPRSTWVTAINQLARYAHVVVILKPDGNFAIADADPLEANKSLLRKGWYVNGGGIPTTSQTQYEAPAIYRLYYTTKREHRFEHDEFFDRVNVHPDPSLPPTPGVPKPKPFDPSQPPLQNRYDRRVLDKVPNDTFWLEQVVRLPQDTLNLQKGQWAVTQDAFNEWNAEKSALPVEAFKELDYPFSYETLLELPPWAGTALATTILRDRTRIGFRNPILDARVAAYYKVRTLLRIPEILQESISSVGTELSSIFATSTRSRVRSPVWCDYVAWDSVIKRSRADESNIGADDPGYGYIRNNPLHDPSDPRYALTGAKTLEDITKLHRDSPASFPVFEVFQNDPEVPPSPFTIKALENSRGVFEISAPTDLTGVTDQYHLGLVDPSTIPARAIGGLSATGNLIVNRMNMTPNFRLFTVLPIVWRTPNHVRKSYYQEVRGSSVLAGASGPLFERKYDGYDVYQVYEPGERPSWSQADGQVFIEHPGKIGNADVATAITKGEAYQHYYRFRPRVIGTFRSPGVDVDLPEGHITETGIVAQRGKVETFCAAERPPKLPNVLAGYAPDVKAIIQRLPRDEI